MVLPVTLYVASLDQHTVPLFVNRKCFRTFWIFRVGKINLASRTALRFQLFVMLLLLSHSLSSLSHFLSLSHSHLSLLLSLMSPLVLFGAVNIYSVRLSTFVSNVSSIAKVLSLCVIITIGFYFLCTGQYHYKSNMSTTFITTTITIHYNACISIINIVASILFFLHRSLLKLPTSIYKHFNKFWQHGTSDDEWILLL